MAGPVFDLEWSRGTQRGRLDLYRRIYSFCLIAEIVALAGGDMLHEFAHRWLVFFLVQQLLLIVMVTPTFVAGAIGDEKARGSLQFLLIADLTSWEIVLGKFLGRLAQVAVVLSVGLPIVCFLGVFAGFPLTSVLVVVGFTLALLFAVGAASVLAAVWTRQTRDAVLALFLVACAFCLGGWGLRQYVLRTAAPGTGQKSVGYLTRGLNHFDLYRVFAPAWNEPDPEELGWRLLKATLAWSGVGVICLGLAMWRLRPAYIKQLQGGRKPSSGRWLQRPAPTDEPLRWKECQVEKAVPLPILNAIPGWLGTSAFFAVLLLWSGYALLRQADRRLLLLEQSIGVTLFASLMVGIRASGAVTSEREHNTWDMLLTTPLETRELLHGKLQGILDAMIPFLIAYGVFALIPSVVAVDLVAGLLTLLGLAATWLAMVLLGAAGILSSVRARSSGQSLLNTLATGYSLSNFRYGPLGTLVFLDAAVGTLAIIGYILTNQLVDTWIMLLGLLSFFVLLGLGPGRVLWNRSQEYLDSAIHYVDKKERVIVKREEYDIRR